MSDTSAPVGTGLHSSPPTGIRIRRATEADAALVDTLVREIAAHQGDHVQAAAADWGSMLTRDDVRVLLAFDGERPVGYVSTIRRFHLWSASDLIALDDLWVRPEARDRGVGRELMQAVADFAAPERLTIVWGRGPTTRPHTGSTCASGPP